MNDSSSDKDDAPATWFIEIEGQKQGPFTSEELIEQYENGLITDASRIFDSTTQMWTIAQALIGQLKNPSKWQPPAKPQDLPKDHIMDISEESTGSIDYFALIAERKRAAQDKQVKFNNKPPSPEEAKKVDPKKKEEEPQEPTKLRHQAVAEPVKHIPKEAQDTEKAVSAEASAEEIKATTKDLKEPTPGKISSLLKFRRQVKAIQKPLAYAAAFAFVFTGTFAIIQTFGKKEQRVVATKSKEQERREKRAERRKAKKAFPYEMAEDRLGKGNNRVKRRRGGVSNNSARRITRRERRRDNVRAAQNTPARAPEKNRPLREPPQFYSTGLDEELIEKPEEQKASTKKRKPRQPSGDDEGFVEEAESADPNEGVVDPPNLID